MDDLAARIRNMRSNYGMGPPVRVAKTGNGRMSEAQAAIALFNLSRYAEHRHRNERLFGLYRDGLGAIPGIKVRVPSGVTESNYQNCICTVDQAAFGLDRDTLCEVLRAENLDVGKGLGPIFAGSQRLAAPHLPNLPNARQFFERIIELPMNEALEDTDAVRIVARIGSIQKDAAAILERLSELA
jgi:dTDP-4-amino-4,6-dideoxygalactose transaminase